MQTDVTLSGWCLGEAEGKANQGWWVCTDPNERPCCRPGVDSQASGEHRESENRYAQIQIKDHTCIRGRIIYFTCIIRCLVDVL